MELFALSVAAGPQRRSLQLLGWIDVEQEPLEMSFVSCGAILRFSILAFSVQDHGPNKCRGT